MFQVCKIIMGNIHHHFCKRHLTTGSRLRGNVSALATVESKLTCSVGLEGPGVSFARVAVQVNRQLKLHGNGVQALAVNQSSGMDGRQLFPNS